MNHSLYSKSLQLDWWNIEPGYTEYCTLYIILPTSFRFLNAVWQCLLLSYDYCLAFSGVRAEKCPRHRDPVAGFAGTWSREQSTKVQAIGKNSSSRVILSTLHGSLRKIPTYRKQAVDCGHERPGFWKSGNRPTTLDLSNQNEEGRSHTFTRSNADNTYQASNCDNFYGKQLTQGLFLSVGV